MRTESVLHLATDLTVALIGRGAVLPDAMPQTLQTIHARLWELQERQERGRGGARLTQAERAGGESWKPSITPHAVTCLECGAAFKQLSTRHLRQHDLDSRSYRAKHGIPRSQSLAAKQTTARRQQLVQQIRPWEKTPTYRKARAGATPARAKRRTRHAAGADPPARR
jgi:predicted transcriptional regulator